MLKDQFAEKKRLESNLSIEVRVLDVSLRHVSLVHVSQFLKGFSQSCLPQRPPVPVGWHNTSSQIHYGEVFQDDNAYLYSVQTILFSS